MCRRCRLTCLVVVFHAVEIIIIKFSVSEQILRLTLAALRLLVLCTQKQRSLSTALVFVRFSWLLKEAVETLEE